MHVFPLHLVGPPYHRSLGETSFVYLSVIVNLNNEYFGDVLDEFNFMVGIFIIS